MFQTVLSLSLAFSCLVLAATPAWANSNLSHDDAKSCRQNDCRNHDTINAKLILLAENEIQDNSLSGQIPSTEQIRSDAESMIIQYRDDPESLKNALATYLSTSDNPLAATNVLLDVLSNPDNEEVSQALQSNAELMKAAGAAIGTTIAIIALTDPDTASAMEASISLQSDAVLKQSVKQGQVDQNRRFAQNTTNQQQDNRDTTPEKSDSMN